MQRLPGENIHYLVEYFTSEFTIPHGEEEVYDKLAGYIGNSFPDVSKFAKDKLREALPIMHQRLRDATLAKCTVELNSVGEIASALHFYEFHASPNDSDIRLLFCCGMIALRYISIALGFCEEATLYGDFNTLHQQYMLTPYYENTNLKSSKKHRFPQTGLDVLEQTKLLYYANFMRAALSLIANRRCKRTRLLRISNALVEGPGVKYITGGGMSAQTRRRVTVFEEESEISPLPPPSQQVKKMVECVREQRGESLAQVVSNKFIGTSEDLRWNRSEVVLSEKQGIHMAVTEAVAEAEDSVTRVVNIYKIGSNQEKVPISDHVVVSQVQEKANPNDNKTKQIQKTSAKTAQVPSAMRDAALEVDDNEMTLFPDDGNEGLDSESLFKHSTKAVLDCELDAIGHRNVLVREPTEDDYQLPTSYVETVALTGTESQEPQVKVLKTSMELNDGRLVRSMSISKSHEPEFSLSDLFGPDDTDFLQDLLCSVTGGVQSLERTSSEGTSLSKVFSFSHPEMLSRQLSQSSRLVRSMTKDGLGLEGDNFSVENNNGNRELSTGSNSSGLKRSWSISSVKAKELDSFLFSMSSESVENAKKKAKTS